MLHPHPVTHGRAHIHRAQGQLLGAAVRPGQPGKRNRDIRAAGLLGPQRHARRHRSAYHIVAFNDLGGHPQQLLLGFFGISHIAKAQHAAGPGHSRKALRHGAAGQAFGGGHRKAPLLQRVYHRVFQPRHIGIVNACAQTAVKILAVIAAHGLCGGIIGRFGCNADLAFAGFAIDGRRGVGVCQ